MKLIVGLGNYGNEYKNTRHNIGFMVIDCIASKYNLKFDKEKFSGKYSEAIINNEKYLFLLPQKYMNLSGEVVGDFVNYYKIDISDILIINDDLDMPTGKIKLKYKGSSGGHNGLKNIELHLGTNEYKRVKVGIANNKLIETKDYVLGKFTSEEQAVLTESISKVVNIVEDFSIMSFDKLMNKYN